jgi:hypothetical protein
MTLIPKSSGLKNYYQKSRKRWVSVLEARDPNKYLVADETNTYSMVDKDDVITYDEYLEQFIKHK